MSETGNLTLANFLTARLDEDERVARLARNPLIGGYPDYRTYDDDSTRAADEFLDRFEPDRALAEVEAKRRLLDYHTFGMGYVEHGADDETSHAAYRAGLETLRFLALPYADHPDYNPDWRP